MEEIITADSLYLHFWQDKVSGVLYDNEEMRVGGQELQAKCCNKVTGWDILRLKPALENLDTVLNTKSSIFNHHIPGRNKKYLNLGMMSLAAC